MESKAFGKDIKDIPICGDLDIKIARDGTWLYRNSPIGRQKLVKLFASVLHKEKDGTFWLITPAERCRIEVEDAPFLAVEMRRQGTGKEASLDFRTNLEEWVELGPSHSLRVKNGVPYIEMDKNLEAKIHRPLYYELVQLADREGDDLILWSRKKKYTLGTLNETR